MPKLLVVEDDENLREIYAKNLTRRDYTVETSTDGNDALNKLTDFKPDVILLDIMMPGLDGKEFLKFLKQSPRYKTIPVIMITGVSDINDIKQCLDNGAAGYVLKGSSTDEIDKKISVILKTLGA